MIARLKDIFTQRREVSILRASLSRVAAERDAARADRDRAEDAALRSFRRRLCLALYGAENMAGTVEELLARVEQIAGEVCVARAEREQYANGLTLIAGLLGLPNTATATEIGEAVAERAHDAAVLAMWRRLITTALGLSHDSCAEDVVDELAALRTFRARTLAALALPADATIEDVEREINPTGWPEGWQFCPYGAERYTAHERISVHLAGECEYAWTSGISRQRPAAAIADALALAATLARRMRQEKP